VTIASGKTGSAGDSLAESTTKTGHAMMAMGSKVGTHDISNFRIRLTPCESMRRAWSERGMSRSLRIDLHDELNTQTVYLREAIRDAAASCPSLDN
jgi:hypothetical protein